MIFNRYKKMEFGQYFIYYNRVKKESIKLNKMIKKNISIIGIEHDIVNIEVKNIYNIIKYELKQLTNIYKVHKNKTIEELLEINDEYLQEVISYIHEMINKAITEQEQYIINKFDELNNLIKDINIESV